MFLCCYSHYQCFSFTVAQLTHTNCSNSSDLKNPEIVTLRNLTMDSAGVYRCTASNDVGEESCTIEVTMQREFHAELPL